MKLSLNRFGALVVLVLVAGTQIQAQQTQTSVNNDLANGSRRAFLEMGMSEKYFDDHFTLVESIDKPGDLRAIWKYSLNGYEAILNDAIGFYTKDSKRVYVHSVKNILGATRDITKTISKGRAAQLMKNCIGNYGGESVQFLRLYPSKAASFYLVAHGYRKLDRKQQGEQVEINTVAPPPSPTGVDQRGAKKGPRPRPTPIGYINLETGKCTKGTAVAAPIMR